MGKSTSGNVAWGLELGGSRVRLARVERTAGGLRVVAVHEQPLTDRWDHAPDVRAALGRLDRAAPGGPLAVAITDERVLCRCVSVPDAPPDVLERIARGQLEALLPAQAEMFVSQWHQREDPLRKGARRLVLCAARADEVRSAAAGGEAIGRRADVVLPSAWATSSALAWEGDERECITVVDASARATTLTLQCGPRPVQCEVIDHGGDHLTERLADELGVSMEQAEREKLAFAEGKAPSSASPETFEAALRGAAGAWARQVREAYGACVEQIQADRRPRRCVLVGRAAQLGVLCEALSESLGLNVEVAAPPQAIALSNGIVFGSAAAAIGAAVEALRSAGPAMNLMPAAAPARPATTTKRWVWAAAGGWLLAAVMGLYLQDLGEARSLSASLARVRKQADAGQPLKRKLAIARHLQPAGGGALTVLDEISALVPKGAILSTWQYNRRGEVRFGGTLPNEKEFHALLEKLRTSDVFDEVTYRSAKKAQGKFQFDISLRASGSPPPRPPETAPAAGKPAKSTQPTQPATKASATSTQPAASAPATRPATRPGGGR